MVAFLAENYLVSRCMPGFLVENYLVCNVCMVDFLEGNYAVSRYMVGFLVENYLVSRCMHGWFSGRELSSLQVYAWLVFW